MSAQYQEDHKSGSVAADNMQVNKHFRFSLRAQRFAYSGNQFVAQLGSTAARYAATGPPPGLDLDVLGTHLTLVPGLMAGQAHRGSEWTSRCVPPRPEGRSPTGRPERQVWTMTGQEIKKVDQTRRVLRHGHPHKPEGPVWRVLVSTAYASAIFPPPTIRRRRRHCQFCACRSCFGFSSICKRPRQEYTLTKQAKGGVTHDGFQVSLQFLYFPVVKGFRVSAFAYQHRRTVIPNPTSVGTKCFFFPCEFNYRIYLNLRMHKHHPLLIGYNYNDNEFLFQVI